MLSISYRQMEQRLPAICDFVVPLFSSQQADPFFNLRPAFLKAEDLPVLRIVVADITFPDVLISLQSLITRFSFRSRREALPAATGETPIRQEESLAFGIQLGMVIKVASGDFLIDSDWEDGFQFWIVSLRAE